MILLLQWCKFVRRVRKNEKEFVLTKQVLGSGTVAGVLSEEAQHAKSGGDFIHRLPVANKEVHKTHYWLRPVRGSEISRGDVEELVVASAELKKFLISIIKSSKA